MSSNIEHPPAADEADLQPQAEEAARPRRRTGEILTLTQLTTDEILAELDRRDRRARQLVARQEKLQAELQDVDRALADIGESLPALAAAATRAQARGQGGRGRDVAPGEAPDDAAEEARPRRRRGPRARNTVSLGDAIAQAVEVRARITPSEAAELVLSNGYVSTAGNFQMTVANTLAKDERFQRISRGVYERVK
jgi:hypothetical protein